MADGTRARSDSPRPLLQLQCLLVLVLLGIGTQGRAESDSLARQSIPPPTTQRDPRDWAREIAASQIANIVDETTYFRYQSHVIDHRGDRTRDVIETRDGTVSRTVLRDGRRLSEEEDRAERDRLSELLTAPSNFARHQKNDAEQRKLAVDLIRLMPDAMIYAYTPGQPQTATAVGTGAEPAQVVLDYRPDPHWRPPTTISKGLTGLRGRMWIDPVHHQLVRMEGTVFQEVDLGWGVLAHIYPGGKLVLEQAEADKHRWMYTHFVEEVTVRAAMVKTIRIHNDISASSFRLLPHPLGLAEAVHLLLETPLPQGQ